jgi:hypothetical protein
MISNSSVTRQHFDAEHELSAGLAYAVGQEPRHGVPIRVFPSIWQNTEARLNIYREPASQSL